MLPKSGGSLDIGWHAEFILSVLLFRRGVATWPVGGSTSITWDTAVPRGATTLHAVSVIA